MNPTLIVICVMAYAIAGIFFVIAVRLPGEDPKDGNSNRLLEAMKLDAKTHSGGLKRTLFAFYAIMGVLFLFAFACLGIAG